MHFLVKTTNFWQFTRSGKKVKKNLKYWTKRNRKKGGSSFNSTSGAFGGYSTVHLSLIPLIQEPGSQSTQLAEVKAFLHMCQENISGYLAQMLTNRSCQQSCFLSPFINRPSAKCSSSRVISIFHVV